MIFLSGPHEYWNDEMTVQYRSVTQILREAGEIDDRFYHEEARERGSAVHELCRRYADGHRYDRRGRQLAGLEYVNAFAHWQADTMAYAVNTECMVHGSHNGETWAGTFDGLFEIKGKLWLLDYKSGAPAKWHAIQLGAYAISCFESGEKINPDRCAALYLHADGTYGYRPIPGIKLASAISKFKECL